MKVFLLRGEDIYRRQRFWGKIKGEGVEIKHFKGNSVGLVNELLTPCLFGKVAYYVDEPKLIIKISNFLLNSSFYYDLIIDQQDSSDMCFRRLARKFEVVRCDPIWAYKSDEVIEWINEVAEEMGVFVGYDDARYLLDNLGEESLEIVRVIELHKITGTPIFNLVEYNAKKAILVVIDSIVRLDIDIAVKVLIYMQQQGVDFVQVIFALLTRYELLLKIKCCQMMGLSDTNIKKTLKLSRMIAGNVISEAKMNSFGWILKFMKNLISNVYTDAGYEWLILVLISLKT